MSARRVLTVLSLALLSAVTPVAAQAASDPTPTSLRFSFTDVEGTRVVRCAERPGVGIIRCPKLALSDLRRPPARQACAAIYGGPERATVTGTLRGHRVRTTLMRTNACEINRWARTADRVLHVYWVEHDVQRVRIRIDSGEVLACGAPGQRSCPDFDAADFAEPTTEVCTHIYGGPERARAIGIIDGRRVDADLDRLGGCKNAQWIATVERLREWLSSPEPTA